MTGGHLIRYAATSFLAVLFAVAGLASPAYAHTELDNAVPAAGSTLGSMPGIIMLAFTEPVDAELATVAVRGPDGERLSDGPVRQSDTGLMQPIVASRKSGMLEVSYRAISLDGHPVSGSFTFRVLRGDPNAQPPESQQAQSGPVGGSGDSSGGDPLTVPLLGAAAVLLLVAAGALLARRRRDSDGAAQPSSSAPPASPPATPSAP